MLLSLVICLFTVCINTVCIDNASTVSDIRTTRIKDHAIKDISIPSLNHLLFNLTDTMSTLAFTIPTILHHQKFIKQVQDTPVLMHIPLSLWIVKKKRTGSIYSPKISTWLKHGYICRSSPDCYIDITIYMDIASNPGPTTTHDLHAGNDQNQTDIISDVYTLTPEVYLIRPKNFKR